MLKLRLPKIYSFELFFWIFYLWYYLPFARAFFYSDVYNLIFFGLFACGCALCVFEFFKHGTEIPLKFTPLVPVLLYLVFFSLLVLFDFGTAARHIRVSFVFWGTLIVYYLTSKFPQARKRLTNLLLILFLVTTVTSMLGVISNPRAARILTYAENDIEEDLIIRILNIGGIAFFQGLVICAPIVMSFIYQNKYRKLAIVMLISIFISIIFASFTISFTLLLFAVLIGYLVNNSGMNRTILAIAITVAAIFIPWSNILLLVGNLLNNEAILIRLKSISDFSVTGMLSGNMASRMEVYLESFNTFLENPLGVGPQYSYVAFDQGIGYHSQFLDDLARYGVLSLVFYAAFFVGYYQLLKKQWSKINMQQIALPVSLLYFLFLVFNLGFTSSHEGVLMLMLIPAFPEWLVQKQRQKMLLE